MWFPREVTARIQLLLGWLSLETQTCAVEPFFKKSGCPESAMPESPQREKKTPEEPQLFRHI